MTWVHSSVVRAADCRSAGPWFKSGCALHIIFHCCTYESCCKPLTVLRSNMLCCQCRSSSTFRMADCRPAGRMFRATVLSRLDDQSLLILLASVLNWVHSSMVRAADCRSAGPWFKSGCALQQRVQGLRMMKECTPKRHRVVDAGTLLPFSRVKLLEPTASHKQPQAIVSIAP